ncbi:hypothetical protein ACK389_21425 [Streptomyces antibioticus]|uniref:hypothetical protein n=1 Tax=Streptomyces antibioticus TaxID=1890 RepID=UPI00340324AE
MTHTHPEIEPLLARLCGGALTTEDYVGYFQNEYGGQLVFAQRRGDKTAGLRHSEADWDVYRVGDHSITVDGEWNGMITAGDLIINRCDNRRRHRADGFEVGAWSCLAHCESAGRADRPG